MTHQKPFLVPVEKGKRYRWCACGASATQPFCDGAHNKAGGAPISFNADETRDLLLCGCKQTKNPPFCDGSHNNLDDGYEVASAEEIASTANAAFISRDNGDTGKSVLDGGAYALTPDPARRESKNALHWQSLIAPADGAKRLSLVEFTATANTPWRRHDGGDTALFITSGNGAVNIEGNAFPVEPETGVFIAKNEAFRFEPKTELQCVAAICGDACAVCWPEGASGVFNKNFPERCVSVNPANRQSMADRFYQVLADSAVGSKEMTQFIGEVPQSRAAFHRHLYEDAIVILNGDGILWTRNSFTTVKPGDVIYLPARQEHSLEATTQTGMRLMGAFYPAGSPAINY